MRKRITNRLPERGVTRTERLRVCNGPLAALRMETLAVLPGPAPISPRGGYSMTSGRNIISLVAQRQDLEQFRKKNWLGTFEDYLNLVKQNPEVARNAFERVYDMIMAAGTTSYEESRGIRRVHYKFFDDPENEGRDAVFGLDEPLEHLVNALKSASKGYGIEKRVLLLHGP